MRLEHSLYIFQRNVVYPMTNLEHLSKLAQKPTYLLAAVALISMGWFYWRGTRAAQTNEPVTKNAVMKNSIQNTIMVTLIVAGVIYLKESKIEVKENLKVDTAPF